MKNFCTIPSYAVRNTTPGLTFAHLAVGDTFNLIGGPHTKPNFFDAFLHTKTGRTSYTAVFIPHPDFAPSSQAIHEECYSGKVLHGKFPQKMIVCNVTRA